MNFSHKAIIGFFFLLRLATVQAQVNIPAPSTPPAAVPVAVPAAYLNPTVNYVRTWTPKIPLTDPIAVTSTDRNASEVMQVTDYFDGLSRPLQTVQKAGSVSGRDLVDIHLYDRFGQTPYQYLPYIQQNGANDGNFKNDPFAAQQNFHKNNPSSKNENIFYSQTVYDQSPNPVAIRSYFPGNAFASSGGNKPMQQGQMVNTALDSVTIFRISNGFPQKSGYYGSNTLFKTIITDPASRQTIIYADISGKTILKKIQQSDNPSPGTSGWLCTYMVYDDLGNLCAVIPPSAVSYLNRGFQLIDVAPGLCYLYRYDARGRTISFKAAGIDSVETIYDTLSRPVCTRDGNLKASGRWQVTFYDVLNRPVRTAMYASSATRATLQQLVDAMPASTLTLPENSLTNLSFIYYDDNYSFPGAQAPVTGDLSKTQAGENPYPDPATVSHRAYGKITGIRNLVLGTGQWLSTTIYYDEKGRQIQSITDNNKGGRQVSSLLYDFSGKLLSTYLRHTNPSSTVTPFTIALTNYTYNGTGQLIQTDLQLNDDPRTKHVLAKATYNDDGLPGARAIGNGLETQSFAYDIQGNLTGINSDYVNAASSDRWFGEEICYHQGFATNQVSGNIAGLKWKGRSDGNSRAYGFAYDPAGRLIKADFSQNQQGQWNKDKIDFSVSGLNYDPNGNILSMKQTGMKGLVPATIDSLKYLYSNFSNALFYVTDAANDPQSKLGDFKELKNDQSQDYAYDSNGNLRVDLNRMMISQHYNHLNLVDSLTVLGQGYIEYLFDASGGKLQKKLTDVSGNAPFVTTYDYLDGFVYRNDSLSYFLHPQGRVRMVYAAGQAPKYVFDYFLSDHLGNTRSVLTEESSTAVYSATMETATSATENALFSNLDLTRAPKPAGYPIDPVTSPNDYVSKLSAEADGQKIGPSTVIRVMAGDTLQIAARAFYKSAAANTSNSTLQAILSSILQAFSVGIAPSDGPHGNGTGTTAPITNLTTANYQQLRDKDPDQNRPDKPKAYLNYVLFDDQMNLVDENSGVRQVQGNPDELQTLATDALIIKKTGFLYVYPSNESTVPVYFDNIVVRHTSGPLLEETHYYPFGLTMAGISSKALRNKYAVNAYNFNGIEQNTDLGLNQYEAQYRTYDPQIARWQQYDPAAEKYSGISPYNFALNNPGQITDTEGDDPFPWLSWFGNFKIGIMLPQVEVRAPFLRAVQPATDGLIRSFETNGFSSIAAFVNARKNKTIDFHQEYLQSLPTRKIDLHEVTISNDRLIDRFPAGQRVYEPYTQTQQASRDAHGIVKRSFKFVNNYFAPSVEVIATGGLEGILTSGPVRAAIPGLFVRVARETTEVAAENAATQLPMQIHHFATNKNSYYTPLMLNIIRRFGLTLDDAWNKMLLPHLGRHPNAYHSWVLEQMELAAEQAGTNPTRFIQLFDEYVKQPVMQNPLLLRKAGW